MIAGRDQSTPQSRSGGLFAMLPYFFILGGFIGGMALAIDTTAGERERQSLEPLLANPVPRWQILVGKLAATTAFAITTVLLGIVAFAVVGRLMPTERIGMTLDIGPGFVARTMLVMLPLAVLLATLQTLVAAFARSFREAQTYVSLLMFVPIIPVMLLSRAAGQGAVVDVRGPADGPADRDHAVAARRHGIGHGAGRMRRLHDAGRRRRLCDHRANLPQRAPGDIGVNACRPCSSTR